MNVEEATLNWRQHMHNVQVSRKLKADAKNKALNSSGTVSYFCFDLQQILDTPFTNVGDVYYKRQLSNYNFVVNDMARFIVICG